MPSVFARFSAHLHVRITCPTGCVLRTYTVLRAGACRLHCVERLQMQRCAILRAKVIGRTISKSELTLLMLPLGHVDC